MFYKNINIVNIQKNKYVIKIVIKKKNIKII